MKNFKTRGGDGGGRSGGFGGRPSFGGNRFGGNRGGGRDDREKQMFEAVCNKCGKTCEVPFRPTGERPVYCRECFDGGKEHSGGGGFRDRNDGPRRPPFARPTFSPAVHTQGGNKEIEDLKRQIDAVHKKLDRILLSMELQQFKPKAPESAEEQKEVTKTDEKKPKAKKKKVTKK